MKNAASAFVASAFLASALPAMSATVIHSWDFEGDFLDDVGAAEGSVTGSTTVGTTTGHDGGTAALFQHSISGPLGPQGVLGTNGTVNIAHTAGSPTITTPLSGFSITYWFKMADDGLTGNPGGNRGFFDFSANTTDSGYQGLYLGTGQLNFRVDAGESSSAAIITTSTVSVEDGNWHHIALTFTPTAGPGGFLAYLDGSLLTNINANGGNTNGFTTNINAMDNPYLGAFNFGGSTANIGLNGALDDFQIWSGVLTPSEVASLAVPVPEPTTALLGTFGLLALLRRRH